jgi:hypothetical protein
MIVLHSASMNSIPRNSGVSKRRLAISNRGSGAIPDTIEHTFDSGKPSRTITIVSDGRDGPALVLWNRRGRQLG